ncbi:fungal specific transcription factor domain-containing protein [Aspergillus melleus]|uniref:fungal specific transcription factor domain-containing protein n=1 Tax=Aspergillus melleus TaxID=138277 RepID=UPI001E8E4D13|nr:uncharacterized protein LDX57_009660 [Aspergillus melleus]KAH8432013.1 hypothetical protein LDX57_009660 [Aspergillus melleus]
MEVKFHISQDGRVPKRKYAKAACDACRRRKCCHEKKKRSPATPSVNLEDNDASYSLQPSTRAPVSTEEPQRQTQAPRFPVEQRQSSQPECSSRLLQADRFIGDLNPVVFFVDDTNTRLMGGRAHQKDVGVWLDRDNDLVSGGEPHAENLSSESSSHHTRGQRGNTRRAVLLPPRQSQEALVDIYLRRIYPILPLIDEHDFQQQFKEGCASPYLIQVICLAASKDHEAEPYLRLANTDILSRGEFGNLLYDELSQVIALRLERKRTTLIQILALLSLHVPGSRSFEDSSLYLAQAIHHAQSMGIHMTRGPAQERKPAIALFWSLWALDRYTAAIQGRPLVIHDRDLGQRLADVIALFEAPFRVFLSLASVLADVFVVYRPALEAPIDSDKPEIPRFEDIIDRCGAWNIPPDTILSLEFVYLAIALLSSRPWVLKDQPKSNSLYVRQDLAVYRMVSLIQICDSAQLLPLPIVSYAISLGFCVAYKQIKRCQLLSTQLTAKQHLQALYKSLEALSPTWWSAQAMTQLGRRALSEVQRTTEKINELPGRNRPSDPVPLAEYINTPVPPGSPASDPVTGMVARTEQAVDLADMEDDAFSYFSGNTSLDIDSLLGNLLNITVPTCPTNPSFTDFDLSWDDQSGYASFY